MQDYIITYTKKHFTPLSPEKEDIDVVDIAHALSLMTRAGGHFTEFYSVAQHSINCAKEAIARRYAERVVLACLLHDASEAYLSDITRPVKQYLEKYMEYEAVLQTAIYEKYLMGGVNEQEEQLVKEIDDAMLYYEFIHYMDIKMANVKPMLVSKPEFMLCNMAKVQEKFLQLFEQYQSEKSCLNHMPESKIDSKIESKIECHLKSDVSMNADSVIRPGITSVGVDGCKGKWIAVEVSPDGFKINKYTTISELCEVYTEADCVLIDMPVGLPESKEQELMRPDAGLRKLLKGKASSVFSVPCRQAVYTEGKEAIRENNIAVLGKSLSAQSIAIIPKIREIDEFLSSHTEWKNRLRESHPEAAFCVLNGGSPIMERKIEADGMERRLQVLEQYYGPSRDVKDQFLAMGYGMGSVNDLLDALCLAVTGQLEAVHGSRTIPEDTTEDARGLTMQVVLPRL